MMAKRLETNALETSTPHSWDVGCDGEGQHASVIVDEGVVRGLLINQSGDKEVAPEMQRRMGASFIQGRLGESWEKIVNLSFCSCFSPLPASRFFLFYPDDQPFPPHCHPPLLGLYPFFLPPGFFPSVCWTSSHFNPRFNPRHSPLWFDSNPINALFPRSCSPRCKIDIQTPRHRL